MNWNSLHVKTSLVVLLEADSDGLLTEALTANHHVVLPDQPMVAVAHSALAGAGAVFAGVGHLCVGHGDF